MSDISLSSIQKGRPNTATMGPFLMDLQWHTQKVSVLFGKQYIFSGREKFQIPGSHIFQGKVVEYRNRLRLVLKKIVLTGSLLYGNTRQAQLSMRAMWAYAFLQTVPVKLYRQHI
jgi:hypothetical protein